jgi:tRNA(Ile)-lysidine synthase
VIATRVERLADGLLRQLRALAGTGTLRCVVAWSGGLDSTVLLHCLLALRRREAIRVRAIHVDHQLQPAAADFRAACMAAARRWRVPLQVKRADILLRPAASVEAAARDARYALLRANLQPGELLLTAHHADDQLETVLLALLRGAGPRGLAAMPAAAPFGAGRLLRPLLDIDRDTLGAYATARQLSWAEDPMNEQARYDRAYLRSRVTPVLRKRWPAVARTAGRSAAHCAEADAVLVRAAGEDLDLAADGPDLEMAVLRRWALPRRNAVLRAWFMRAGCRPPDLQRLAQLQRLMDARADAQPELQFADGRVRRFDGRLILVRGDSAAQARVAVQRSPAAAGPWAWQERPLELPDGAELAIRPDAHGDLDLARLPARLQVRFATPEQAPHWRSVRKRLQSLDVPAWERRALPMLFSTARAGASVRLIAIADLWVAPQVQCRACTHRRGRIFWQPPP